MGLDTVEILIAVERTFDIRVPDRDAERIITVRDLTDYVFERVRHSETAVCRSQRTFYRLRSAIALDLGVDPQESAPARGGRQSYRKADGARRGNG